MRTLLVAIALLLAPPLLAQSAGDNAPKPIEASASAPAAPASSLADWVDLDVEYRVQTVYVNPLELSGTDAREVTYTEQRLSLEPSFKLGTIGRIATRFDVLDGVLFGDNGDFGHDPEPAFGMALTSRWPNAAGWTVGLVPGRDPLDPDSYTATLRGIEPIRAVHAYGEVLLPVGLLRIGRQPAASGPGINLHDGSRSNRWGVSRYVATADRFLFATNLSAVIDAIATGKRGGSIDLDRGVFIGVAYDQVVNDDVSVGQDDLHQMVGLVQWKDHDMAWFGLPWKSWLLQVIVGGRFGDEFNTQVLSIPATLAFEVGPVRFRGEFVTIFGHTREISEGLAALREADATRRVIRDQDLLMFGGQAMLDVDVGPVTTTLELDYASGDSDPRDDTPMTTYNFARDANVGLLLFEHILAFETARSAAVGIENLRNMGTASFPLTELSSEGRVHNAMCIFPQVLYRPVESLGIRTGALFAWSAAPVVDPIMTLLNEDGARIEDDAVNWHGGKPARYYGTELDLQVEWTYRDHFIWTVEGAVLIPGDALKDAAGDGVTSFLVQNRFTFVF